MERILKEVLRQGFYLAPRVVTSLLVLVFFWVMGVIVFKMIHRMSERPHLILYRDGLHLMGRLSRSTLIILGLVTALGTVGVNVSALVAGLGLTGFALGFAFRDILSNVLAGILILVYRPFKPSDYISVTGLEGVVMEIDLRYTTLQSPDKKILIPNSVLFTNPISLIQNKTDRPP